MIRATILAVVLAVAGTASATAATLLEADTAYLRGDYTVAERDFQALREASASKSGEQTVEYATLLAKQANVYREQQRYDLGVPMAEWAVSVMNGLLGFDDRGSAFAYATLATMYRVQGYEAEAYFAERSDKFMWQSLKLLERERRADSDEIAALLFIYSTVFHENARDVEGDDLDIRLRALGYGDGRLTYTTRRP